ncbi:uncharacterized protein BX664DRAFT_316462 [Halteromyces radiatus]|uniref:uncharacterized protein n=1 Tax=Halteromyces radiatus TaxID=101107 RepID=UPI00221E39DE|nr:uncharacterized protein BX664DRAFT_316462 [Halteromyces radiatus]KAI8084948.1 hypothetical protein BX664DRAFT_316462 [Halteromyces radiatus]
MLDRKDYRYYANSNLVNNKCKLHVKMYTLFFQLFLVLFIIERCVGSDDVTLSHYQSDLLDYDIDSQHALSQFDDDYIHIPLYHSTSNDCNIEEIFEDDNIEEISDDYNIDEVSDDYNNENHYPSFDHADDSSGSSLSYRICMRMSGNRGSVLCSFLFHRQPWRQWPQQISSLATQEWDLIKIRLEALLPSWISYSGNRDISDNTIYNNHDAGDNHDNNNNNHDDNHDHDSWDNHDNNDNIDNNSDNHHDNDNNDNNGANNDNHDNNDNIDNSNDNHHDNDYNDNNVYLDYDGLLQKTDTSPEEMYDPIPSSFRLHQQLIQWITKLHPWLYSNLFCI